METSPNEQSPLFPGCRVRPSLSRLRDSIQRGEKPRGPYARSLLQRDFFRPDPHPHALERIAADYTVAQYGKALGVTHQAVSSWEAKKSIPEQERFEKMAELLGLTEEQVEDMFLPSLEEWDRAMREHGGFSDECVAECGRAG